MNYTPKYESPLLRGVEDPRPWNLFEEIRNFTQKSHIVLDIGCGTAAKIIRLANDVKLIYGLEPNVKMRAKAQQNISKEGFTNIVLVDGCSDQIPFPENTFDIVTCMLAHHNAFEIYRVLKPGGYAIIEKIGDREKWNLKNHFGNDEIGPRGQFSYYEEGQRAKKLQSEFEAFFSEVSVRNESWKTYYKPKSLIPLLEQTPTVRNFDRHKDAEALQKIKDDYMTEKGIETEQNRILIWARK